jgi:hypothetical protein
LISLRRRSRPFQSSLKKPEEFHYELPSLWAALKLSPD